MRRFSQRSSLVTLSEINITPLLDLAFVLLIIFVITTPLLTQSIEMTLPTGGHADSAKLDKRDIRTIEISPTGVYSLEGTRLALAQLEAALVREFKANPRLVVYIRADELGKNKDLYAVWDLCERNNIRKVGFKTRPPDKR